MNKSPTESRGGTAAPRVASVSHQMHSTPASSLWEQLCTPQLGFGQSKIECSPPLQFTSSSQICPVPLEDELNKQQLDKRKRNMHFFFLETPVDSRWYWVAWLACWKSSLWARFKQPLTYSSLIPRGTNCPFGDILFALLLLV